MSKLRYPVFRSFTGGPLNFDISRFDCGLFVRTKLLVYITVVVNYEHTQRRSWPRVVEEGTR